MAEVRYNPQGPVWDFTYAQGPDAGKVIVQSPQNKWNKGHGLIVVRQVNSDGQERAWVNKDPSLFVRCNPDNIFPSPADAHAVVLVNGWGPALNPTCGPSTGDGAPMVPYYRGERVWIEKSLDSIRADGLIPVVSIDTMQQYKLPHNSLCFVPQLEKTDKAGAKHFATPVGPYRVTTCLNPPRRARSYFEWSDARPHEARRLWDCQDPNETEPGRSMSRDYHPIESTEERRRLFQEQWDIATAALHPKNDIKQNQYPDNGDVCEHGMEKYVSAIGSHYLPTSEGHCTKSIRAAEMNQPNGRYWSSEARHGLHACRAVL